MTLLPPVDTYMFELQRGGSQCTIKIKFFTYNALFQTNGQISTSTFTGNN